MRDTGLVALLVLTVVLIAFAMRTPATPTASATQSRVSLSPSATPSPTESVSESPSPTPSPVGPQVAAFLGDSFAEGKGATTPAKRFTTLLSATKGWTEENLAHAGTGYLRATVANLCAGAPCPNFGGQAAALASLNPAVVVVSGGANDAALPAEQVAAAMTTTLAEISRVAPAAKVFVVNPWWDDRPLPAELTPLSAAISAAATAAGATYVDIGQPLHDTPTLLTGGEANDQGHARLAELLAAKIQ